MEIGMNTYGFLSDLTTYDNYLEDMKMTNFEYIRVSLREYDDITSINISKNHVLLVLEKGLKPIWGICSLSLDAASWVDYRVAVLEAAAWAEANGVYEFQLGNELEAYVDGITLTVADLITNLKSLATEVQAIYTRGNVSYTCGSAWISDWVTAGKGDLDILASNCYKGITGISTSDRWMDEIDALVGAFGVDGTYLTEFSLSSVSLDTYSSNEDVQVNALNEMVSYIKSSGMTRALFFSYNSDDFGALKDNGVYRKLWDVLKIQNDWKRRKTAGQANIRGLSHG